MSDLLEYLYKYVMENPPTDDPEYKENRAYANKALGALTDSFSPEQRERFDKWEDLDSLAGAAAQKTLFRAGLRMGLELGAFALYHS